MKSPAIMANPVRPLLCSGSIGALLLAACVTTPSPPPRSAGAGALRVYVGTYTSGDSASKGIYRLRLDLATGALTHDGEPTDAVNPSWVTLHPNGRFLYAVNETGDGPGAASGSVSAFAVEPVSGALTFLDRQPSGGGAPCHLTFDRTGRHLLVANYWGGSVSVFPLREDGGLAPASAFVQHTGGTRAPGRETVTDTR